MYSTSLAEDEVTVKHLLINKNVAYENLVFNLRLIIHFI